MKRHERGSEWRKWDLHVHSPDSLLENKFQGNDKDDKWERYINALSNISDISVLGITDYFSIEGYKNVREKFDNNELDNFDEILPNCEIRIDPRTTPGKRINLHFIFNPEIVEDLEDSFFSKLKYTHSDSDNYYCTKSSMIKLGRKINEDSKLHENSALKSAAKVITFSLEKIEVIMKNNRKLRENCLIIIPNSSQDGASGLYEKPNGERMNVDEVVRKRFYNLADMLFSSSKSDVNFWKSIKSQEEYGKKMSCIHGSDAHENSKIGVPDNQKFNWIKADPTFEGLKQLKYEFERSFIGITPPDFKKSYDIIKRVRFITSNDKVFEKKWIEINRNMVSIIGGKSTGKSLLTYLISQTVNYSDDSKKWLESIGVDYEPFIEILSKNHGFDFEVEWGNGELQRYSDRFNTSNRNLTYIAQLEINNIAENRLSKKYLNIVEGAFNVNSPEKYEEFNQLREEINQKFSNIRNNMIPEVFTKKEKTNKIEEDLKQMGKKDELHKELEVNNKKLNELLSSSEMSKEELDIYNSLIEKKNKLKEELDRLKSENETINKMLVNASSSFDSFRVYLKEILSLESNFHLHSKREISNILSDTNEVDIQKVTSNIRNEYKSNYEKLQKKVKHIDDSLSPITKKLAKRESLKPLRKAIENDTEKLRKIEFTEKELSVTQEKIKEDMRKIDSTLDDIKKKLRNISGKHMITDEIKFEIENIIDTATFNRLIKTPLKIGYFRQKFNKLINENDILNDTADPLKIIKISLEILHDIIDGEFDKKQNQSLYEIAQNLFRNVVLQDINLIYKSDKVDQMSPGKKGMVLLKLIIEMDDKLYPIIIDQPEDNLDNQTIYRELVSFLKNKKIQRQIIIVTHNANLAVLTDSEQIIVAQQVIKSRQQNFKYYSGSLENSFVNKKSKENQLERHGIKQHVCTILEGGIEAFNRREEKYFT